MKYDSVDKRRALRVVFPFTTHIYIFGKGPISTYTENISERGIRVIIREELKISSKVDLEIYIHDKPVCCKACIVWVKRKETEYIDGEVFFDIGMEFTKINQDDTLVIRERVKELEKSSQHKE